MFPLKTTVKSSRSATVPLTRGPVNVSPLNSTGQRENNGVNGLAVENNGMALVWLLMAKLKLTVSLRYSVFQKGDVYSFAILLQQIILRSEPFELPGDPLEMSVNEILKEVIRTQTFLCECLLWVQIIT